MQMMRVINGAGMRRLANPYGVIVFALAAEAIAGAQQPAPVRVMVRAKGDTFSMDSAAVVRARDRMIVMRKVDSLVNLQNGTTIGSPEYRRLDEELFATVRAMLPTGPTAPVADGRMTIILPDEAIPAVAKRAFDAPRAMMIDAIPRGQLGFTADGYAYKWYDPDGLYVHYIQYPTVVAVEPNSPASKVGLQFGDSILAYNGQDLLRTEINLTRLLEPGAKVALKVRQEGETKEFSINVVAASPQEMVARRLASGGVAGGMVARAPVAAEPTDRPALAVKKAAAGGRGGAVAPFPRNGVMAAAVEMPVGVLGAKMTDVDSATAANLTQRKATHGVLVIGVGSGSPAERIGILSGDLIIGVADVDINSLLQLNHEVYMRGASRPVQFIVLRRDLKGDLKTEKLTYDPRD
jgi:membrane-associated protease RseP (regulator of RpoE activity)